MDDFLYVMTKCFLSVVICWLWQCTFSFWYENLRCNLIYLCSLRKIETNQNITTTLLQFPWHCIWSFFCLWIYNVQCLQFETAIYVWIRNLTFLRFMRTAYFALFRVPSNPCLPLCNKGWLKVNFVKWKTICVFTWIGRWFWTHIPKIRFEWY